MDIAFAHTLHIAMSEGATGGPTSSDADQDVTPWTCTSTTRRHILDTPASEGLIFLVLVLFDYYGGRVQCTNCSWHRGYFPSAWSGCTAGVRMMTRMVGTLTLEGEKQIATTLTILTTVYGH